MTLEAIKEAIAQLPSGDRLALESWLAEAWDAEIERDFSPGGPGMQILDKVKTDIRQAKFTPFDQGRPRRL